jgi:hypothetical protein
VYLQILWRFERNNQSIARTQVLDEGLRLGDLGRWDREFVVGEEVVQHVPWQQGEGKHTHAVLSYFARKLVSRGIQGPDQGLKRPRFGVADPGLMKGKSVLVQCQYVIVMKIGWWEGTLRQKKPGIPSWSFSEHPRRS